MSKFNEQTGAWEGESSPEPERVWDEATGTWKTVADWDDHGKKWVNPPKKKVAKKRK